MLDKLAIIWTGETVGAQAPHAVDQRGGAGRHHRILSPGTRLSSTARSSRRKT